MSGRRVVVEADGGSRGNPGPAGYGAIVRDADTGELIAERKEAIGRDTNNVAEYRGLIAGLQAAAAAGADSVVVRMDSKLVVEQMSGRWQVKNDALRRLVREAAALRSGFAEVSFEWIPRESNKHADRLANEAMDIAMGRIPGAPRPIDDEPRPSYGAPSSLLPSWTMPAGTPTRLVLVRHGSTQHSADRRFSGRNDLPLDEAGEQQAVALAARALSFSAVAALLSSPLARAMQTAQIVGAALNLTVQAVDAFAEADFGEWEGHTLAEVQRDWPAELAGWLASPDVAPPGGEPLSAVERRVRRARDDLIAAHPGHTVVVVTHVTPIKSLLRLALGAGPEAMYRIHLDTGSISVADYYADGQSSVRLMNDTGGRGV